MGRVSFLFLAPMEALWTHQVHAISCASSSSSQHELNASPGLRHHRDCLQERAPGYGSFKAETKVFMEVFSQTKCTIKKNTVFIKICRQVTVFISTISALLLCSLWRLVWNEAAVWFCAYRSPYLFSVQISSQHSTSLKQVRVCSWENKRERKYSTLALWSRLALCLSQICRKDTVQMAWLQRTGLNFIGGTKLTLLPKMKGQITSNYESIKN